MKKVLALVMVLAMVLSMASFAAAEEGNAPYSGDVKIWVAEATVEFTQKMVEEFKALYPEYAGANYIVQPVGEGDAANNVIVDVEGAADIFGFAQDQLARLGAADALMDVNPDLVEEVKAANDPGSVAAVTLGDTMYAYPMTSDNGYFLYYDKSVVSDPSTLEGILADCEKAGKNLYFEINSGWYQTAFFFGAGCTLTYDTDDAGNLVGINCDYASENGLKALKAMIETAKSPAFANGSSVSAATNIGAIVDGTWDASSAKEAFGDNYAATKLPTVAGFQLGGFGGFKMMGVKPQDDEAKMVLCDLLAYFLTSEEVQIARYDAVKWGPSNLNAQKDEAVQADEALSALASQLAFAVPQGQYPNEYWSLATGLGDDVLADKLDDADDATLMATLQTFQDTAASYVK